MMVRKGKSIEIDNVKLDTISNIFLCCFFVQIKKQIRSNNFLVINILKIKTKFVFGKSCTLVVVNINFYLIPTN